MTPNDTWAEWKRLVLSTLEAQTQDIKGLEAQLGAVQRELVALQIKAGIWGAAAGAIPAIVVLLWRLTN